MRMVQPTGVLLVASIVAGCGREPVSPILTPAMSVADGAGSWAGGHGNWINPAGERVSRSFHGRVMPDGSVQGNFEQHITALDGTKRINRGDITCLRLLAPNDAVLSGPIHVNANPAIIGWTQIFRVQDNGEGEDSGDRMSGLTFRAPEPRVDCQTFTPPPPATEIFGGNLQVRP
jgi:hypothetical protein